MNIKPYIRQVVILVFGILFPTYVLLQAYQSVSSLQSSVEYKQSLPELINNFQSAKSKMQNIDDYALFSLMYVEHANQKTMINKQVMKTAVMHIGFSAISIGMMLIILGINDGGVEGGVGTDKLRFDFKTGSTGVAVFVIGALMATAGGVMKNDYHSSQIPDYCGSSFSSSSRK